MAWRLAAVPEESMDCSTAAYPPRSIYRDSIRRVAVSGAQIRSPLFSHSQSDHSGCSYSSNSCPSNSYPSNNSACSSGSPLSVAAADFGIDFFQKKDFGTDELKTIARQMVSDGYTQRMVQAFQNGDDPDHGPDSVLESWFLELDVAWVLQIRQERGSDGQLCLQYKSASSLQDLVQRWIRGLTVIVGCINDPVFTPQQMPAVARFGQASISKMSAFVNAIVPVFKAENLRAVLDMYVCVCRESQNMEHSEVCQGMEFIALPFSLYMSVNKLKGAISSTMEKVRTLIEEDDSWAIEIPQGGTAVHRNTRLIAECLVSLSEAEVDSIFITHTINLSDVTDGNNMRVLSDVKIDTIRCFKDLLLRKSEVCSDPSMRYLFLLNNSYFVLAQMIEPCEPRNGWRLLECDKFMDSYLDVSWGHVLSCIPKSHSPGPFQRWMNTPSLAKFESAFHRTYQAQKFWKVPDPELRSVLRRAITDKVVSNYRDYLKEHPELAERARCGNSNPNNLEEMLGEIFEG